MLKSLTIFWNSFKMSLQELNNNKLRSALSLTGIAFGIFCIIGVLATVNSLESKVQSDIKAIGSNTIYIDKWEYSGGADYPWWKYVNRPMPKYNEVSFIKNTSTLAKYVCYFNSTSANASFEKNQINNTGIYGASEEFSEIQTIDMAYGRYLSESEFKRGNPVCVMGYEIAKGLYDEPARAIDKEVTFDKKKFIVIGVIKKQGNSFIGGYDYDNCIIITYRSYASIYDVNKQWSSNPVIMVNSRDNVSTKALADELKGIMRQARRLGPKEEDDFTLNDVNLFSQQVSGFFGTVNIGGWAIAGLSLIVGAFGVANIMFVTVRERTSQIGLKKAIGAKSRTILTEFLLESAFLCIIGGLIGLAMVGLLALALSSVLPFPIVISPNIITLAFTICVVLGILSGIIPASIAARMDPVAAIRK